jgi:hypothetical protein
MGNIFHFEWCHMDIFCSGEITIQWCFLIFNLGLFSPLPFAASTLKVEEVSFGLLWCEQMTPLIGILFFHHCSS